MGIVTIVAAAVGAAIVGTISKIVADDFKAWSPALTRKLLKHAGRKLPPKMRDRCDEEWASYVADVPGDLSKIICALGFVSTAWKIAIKRRPLRINDTVVYTVTDYDRPPVTFSVIRLRDQYVVSWNTDEGQIQMPLEPFLLERFMLRVLAVRSAMSADYDDGRLLRYLAGVCMRAKTGWYPSPSKTITGIVHTTRP